MNVAKPAETLASPGTTEAIGPQIRRLREKQGLSLRVLAQRCGLSVGFLSQVERGLSSLALASLQSVADALDTPVAGFFAQQRTEVVEDDAVIFTLTRASERPRPIVSGGRHYELLSARVPGLVLEPMLVYIEPGGIREPLSGHAGEEFAYVIAGELCYEVAGTEYRLGVGDSLFMRSNTPHRMHNDGTETVVVVSVVTPRHF